MFALSLAAACAVTVADVREVEGQELELPQLPQVQVPSLPKVPQLQPPPRLEIPETPKLPAAPLPRVQAPTPAVPGSGSAPEVSTGGGGPAGASGRSSANQTRPPAGGVRAGAAPEAGHQSSSRRRATARKAPTRRERRFRRAVRQLWACSYAVSGFERKVLVRRAGIDGYSAAPSTTVAHDLGVSVARVRKAQSSGVRRLRSANRSDGCAMSNPPSGIERTVGALRAVATAPALVASGSATLADAESSSAPQSDGEGAVLGERRASTPVNVGRPQVAGTLTAAGGDDGSEPWLLILILALMAIAAATPVVLRRRHESDAAPQAASREAPPQVELKPPEPVEPPAWSQELAPPPWAEPKPRAPAPEPPHGSRRAAGIGLSAVASLAVTLLMRSRRRR